MVGTTSACAENTEVFQLCKGCVAELPPRARRIPAGKKTLRRWAGTTSACAENTTTPAPVRGGSWNYLRVRGEYIGKVFPSWWESELPPRARRIHQRYNFRGIEHGTTSACAENTGGFGPNHRATRNYLRVRGEYFRVTGRPSVGAELPPRARRIHAAGHANNVAGGTTSACAENTAPRMRLHRHSGNYLRVRGEYSMRELIPFDVAELPPRARRIP